MQWKLTWKKPVVFIACLLPLVWILWRGFHNQLGPDPGKAMVLATGLWTLRFLLITLAITPLRKAFGRYLGIGRLLAYRRMLGLYAWFYATLHFASVWTYLLGWSLATFEKEFVHRPYMTVGILAWLMLAPLGVTSNRWAQRKLGRRWKRLHQAVYIIAILGCIHFFWLVRSDYGEVLLYSAILLVLLLARLPNPLRHSWRSVRQVEGRSTGSRLTGDR